jgi:hypothetical protein
MNSFVSNLLIDYTDGLETPTLLSFALPSSDHKIRFSNLDMNGLFEISSINITDIPVKSFKEIKINSKWLPSVATFDYKYLSQRKLIENEDLFKDILNKSIDNNVNILHNHQEL